MNNNNTNWQSGNPNNTGPQPYNSPSGNPMQNTGNTGVQTGVNNYTSVSQYTTPTPQRDIKKRNMWVIWFIIIGVLTAAIIAAAVIAINMNKRNAVPQTDPYQQGVYPPGPPPMATGDVMINGMPAQFDVIKENDRIYLPAEEFAQAMYYQCTVDGDSVTLTGFIESSTLTVGSTDVKVHDNMAGTDEKIEITTKPFKRDGKIYFYCRDAALFMKNVNVTYNSLQKCLDIMGGQGGPGGPGGPPPGGPGGPPPGMQGAPPQGGQGVPPQGGQGVPPQGGQGAPPQGGQPPQN